MDLWERGLHAGLVRDTEEEGAALEGTAANGKEENDEAISLSCHDTVLSGKLRQAVCRATDKEGGGCFLPDDQFTKSGLTVAEVIQEKHPDMRLPTVENPTFAAFKAYGKVPGTVSLDNTKDDATWLASKLSSPADAPGAEAMELRIWLLHFGSCQRI